MLPKTHIMPGFIFALIVLLIFPKIGIVGFIVIFLSSFLIDIDHYLYYVWHKKNISPKNAVRWYMSNREKFYSLPKEKVKNTYNGFYIFHGPEAIILLLALYLIFKQDLFLFVLAGFIFHEFLDLMELMAKQIKSYKLHSFFYSIYKKKDMVSIEDVKWTK